MRKKTAAAGMSAHPGKACLILLALLALIAVPASAGNYTSLDVWTVNSQSITFTDTYQVQFDALQEKSSAIAEITLSGVSPGTINITLTQGNGAAHTGVIEYIRTGTLDAIGEYTLTLDGNSKSWSGLDTKLDKIYLTAYVKDLDTNQIGLIITEAWIGNFVFGYTNSVFAPVSNLGNYPITKIEITSTDKITATIKYADTSEVSAEVTDEDFSLFAWVGKLFEFVANVSGILFSLIAAFKFIVIDHFFSLIVLYESLCMAYAASKSRDIFTFVKKFFRMNKSLFEAIIGFISVIITIFHKLIDAIKP